ncbi:hypothetical protein BLNAU_14591 [Blattamonas nauphoetae]|uniref:Uncharacterized protein n=1 Tax=Blattamonas nauphoetae TaxID=2049346 RepID=A0ABQ9XD96_9EUKA|nr:hypothetical protein BLNAU_14591 [Blattamonas nauphoetae]
MLSAIAEEALSSPTPYSTLSSHPLHELWTTTLHLLKTSPKASGNNVHADVTKNPKLSE